MPISSSVPSGSFNNFAKIAAELEAGASRAVRLAAFHINERLQAKFREPKSGRWYGSHRASAPGQAPAIDFGTLASSYRVIEVDKFKAVVASSSEEAPLQEYGTRNMEPRPHLYPAAEEERPDFEKAIATLLRRYGG